MILPIAFKEVAAALELKNSLIDTQRRVGALVVKSNPTPSVQTTLDLGKSLSDRGLIGSAVPSFIPISKANDKTYERRILGSIPVESWLESRFKIPLRLLFSRTQSHQFNFEKIFPLIMGIATVIGIILFALFWTSALIKL